MKLVSTLLVATQIARKISALRAHVKEVLRSHMEITTIGLTVSFTPLMTIRRRRRIRSATSVSGWVTNVQDLKNWIMGSSLKKNGLSYIDRCLL